MLPRCPPGCCLSGADAVALLETIDECVACETASELRERVFSRLQGLIPFDFACALLGHHDAGTGVITAHGFVDVSLPAEFGPAYVASHYLQSDPIVLQNFRRYALQRWSGERMTHRVATEVAARRLRMSKGLLGLFMDCGMNGGYTHGSRPRAPREYGSMFCFLGPAMKPDVRTEAILERINPHLHLALSRALDGRRQVKVKLALSARETEVLEWVKEGKSAWEASVILGISERTVRFHVANIMRKLGASNRAQAVAIALQLGLVHCS
jgi:DNA-binding CsgD family transcriptional regulator